MIVKKWIDTQVEIEVDIGPEEISDLLLEDDATTRAQCLNIVNRAWDVLRTVDPTLIQDTPRKAIADALELQAKRFRPASGAKNG